MYWPTGLLDFKIVFPALSCSHWGLLVLYAEEGIWRNCQFILLVYILTAVETQYFWGSGMWPVFFSLRFLLFVTADSWLRQENLKWDHSVIVMKGQLWFYYTFEIEPKHSLSMSGSCNWSGVIYILIVDQYFPKLTNMQWLLIIPFQKFMNNRVMILEEVGYHWHFALLPFNYLSHQTIPIPVHTCISR